MSYLKKRIDRSIRAPGYLLKVRNLEQQISMALTRIQPTFDPSGSIGYDFVTRDILVTEDLIMSDEVLTQVVARHQVTVRPTNCLMQTTAEDDQYLYPAHRKSSKQIILTPGPGPRSDSSDSPCDSPRSTGINPDASVQDGEFTVGNQLDSAHAKPEARFADGVSSAASCVSAVSLVLSLIHI